MSSVFAGAISATTADHVRQGLNGKVELILDGGATPLGLESTVVGFQNDAPVLLRPGAVARSEIELLVGPLAAPRDHAIQSPGQFDSHYAPRGSVRLNAVSVKAGEALLAFGPNAPKGARTSVNLSQTADLNEAAANLFAMLHELDASGLPIAVMPIPQQGLGEAINDRLQRAAAPRVR